MNVTTQEATPTARWLTLRRAIAAAFTAALTVMGLLPLLGATAAGAATAVSSPTISLSSYGAGATSVMYTLGFTTSSTGALTAGSGTITLNLPTGTTLPAASSNAYTVNPNNAGAQTATSVTVSGSQAVITTPVAVADATPVTVTITGVTNPSTVSGTDQASISTSSDTAAALTAAYAITSGISALTGPTPTPATANTAYSVYTVGFKTSASGSLVGGAGTITLSFVNSPTAATFPGTAGAYIINNVAVTNIASGGGTASVTLTVPGNVNIGPSSSVTVIVFGAHNPQNPGNYTINVSTSSDTAPSATSSFVIGTSVANAKMQTGFPSPDTAGATSTVYHASFNASNVPAGSGNLAAGTGTITLTFPTGTTLPTTASLYTVTASNAVCNADGSITTANVTASAQPSSVNVSGTSVTITTPVAVTAGDCALVSITGAGNPGAGTAYTFSASSSADVAASTSTTYTIATSVTNVTVAPSTNLVGTGVGNPVTAAYTISFTATTAISGNNSTPDTVTFCPSGANSYLPNGPGDYVFQVASGVYLPGVSVGAASNTPGAPNSTLNCAGAGTATAETIQLPEALSYAAGQTVSIVVNPIVNPAASTANTIAVSTTGDTSPVASSAFSTVAVSTNHVYGQYGSPSVTNAGGANYVVNAVAYSTSTPATVTVTAPCGTVFSTGAFYTVNGNAGLGGAAGTSPGCGTAGNVLTITNTANLTAGTAFTVTVPHTDVTFPTGTYNTSWQIETATDNNNVATTSFQVIGAASGTKLGSPVMVPTSFNTTPFGFNISTNAQSNGSLAGNSNAYVELASSEAVAEGSPFTATTAFVNGVMTASTQGGGPGDYTDSVTIPNELVIANGGKIVVTIVGSTATLPAATTTFSMSIGSSADNSDIGLVGNPTAANISYSLSPAPTSVVVDSMAGPTPGVVGQAASYTINFHTSGATTALNGGSGQIILDASTTAAGTVFPSATSDYDVNNVSVGSVGGSVSLSNSNATATITLPSNVGSSVQTFSLSVSSVTNPTKPATYHLEVSTSADQSAVTSGNYEVSTAVSNLIGPAADPATTGLGSTYTIGFITSAFGDICGANTLADCPNTGNNGQVAVIAPSGTVLTGAGDLINGMVPAAETLFTTHSANDSVVMTLNANQVIPAETPVFVSLMVTTNPAPGSTYSFSVHTTDQTSFGDQALVSSSSYSIGSAITHLAVTYSSENAQEPANYTVNFCATSGLVGGTDTVAITAASGTTFPSSGYGINSTSTTATVGTSPNSVTVSDPSGINVAANNGCGGGTDVSLVINGVTNPAGSQTLSVTTSKDSVPVTSAATVMVPPAAPTVSAVSPATGPTAGGTSVVITGTNFTSAATVKFGSTAATSVSVTSATSLTASSPATTTAGTVDVTVSTAGGTSATSSSDQFAYTAPVPAVSAISPTSGLVAGGTTVTVTGSGFTGATEVDFTPTGGGAGGKGTSLNVASDTSLTVVSPAEAAGTYDITVLTPGGTSPKTAADVFTYSNCSAPTVTAVSPANGPEAGGTSVTITGTNFEVGSGSSATCQATAVMFGSVNSDANGPFTLNSATSITVASPAGSAGAVDVTVVGPGGTSAMSAADKFTYNAVSGQGYWLVTSQGTVDAYGSAPAITPAGMNLGPNKVVAIATSPGGTGYWLVDSAGNIYTAGTALYYGGPSQLNPNLPAGGSNAAVVTGGIVGIAATADGKGYWEVDGQGDIFTFGDAVYHGTPAQLNPSAPAGGSNSVLPLNSPIVGIVSTGDGQGYWEVGADGGIFTFGDATFQGSMGGVKLAAPVVGMIAFGTNYEMVGADGGVFTFPPGSPIFHGSEHGSLPAGITAVGIAETSTGAGYWIANSSTPAANFGDAQSLTGPAASGVVAIAAS